MNRRRVPAAGALAVAGILLGAGVVGFLAHRLTASAGGAGVHAAPAAPQGPWAAAPALLAQARPAARRAIPERLPDFSLPDLKGVTHRLADYGGQPLIINFWATWCEPCRREIPLLKSLRRENTETGVELVGIAIDRSDSVLKFVRELGIDYPVLLGERGGLEAVNSFGVDTVLPFTVFANADGRIVTLKIGELHRDEASFILARLAELKAGRVNLAVAREQIANEIQRLSAARAQAPQAN